MPPRPHCRSTRQRTSSSSILAAPPGAFTTIQAACDAAHESDVVLVKSGSYASFGVVNKTLTVAADAGANVQIQGGIRVRNLAPTKTVVLVGLHAQGARTSIPNDVYGFSTTANQGHVRAVDCTFRGVDGILTATERNGRDAVHFDATADVALSRCSATGGLGQIGYVGQNPGGPGVGGVAVEAIASQITLHDCTLNGGDGVDSQSPSNPDGGVGAHAYLGINSTLFASKTTFHGGNGGDGQSALCFGSFGGDGGHCFVLQSSGDLARLVSPTEIPGVSGTSFGGFCAFHPGGMASARVGAPAQFVDFSFVARSMSVMPNPIRESSTLAITLTGQPGDRVAIILSPTTASVFNTQWNGQQMFPLPAQARSQILGFVPVSGTFTYNLGLSDLGPGVQARTFFAQPLFDAVGGERVLGTAIPLLVLDSAF